MTRCALASAFLLSALTLAVLGAVGPASAKPTEAQLSAIKSNCRSDFMSNCWGVPRGGAEAFQCLKEHMASLSPGCAQAVKAATPAPAAPKKAEPAPAPAAEPAPAPAEPEPAPTAAETPPKPQDAAPKTASPAPESAPPPAPKAASEPPKAEAKAPPPATPSPAPAAKAPAPAAPEAAPAAPKAAAVEPETPAPIIGFIPPRKKLMVLRNCRQDLETYCAGVDYGDGRQLHCLFSNKASLTPDCQGALAKLAN